MADEPTSDTSSLFIWASGFGMGVVVVTIALIFMVQIGSIGHSPLPSQSSAAQSTQNTTAQPAQNSAQPGQNTPAQPGQAARPSPGTQAAQPGQAPAPATQPQTSGQGPAPAR
jgi:hypothetical protein